MVIKLSENLPLSIDSFMTYLMEINMYIFQTIQETNHRHWLHLSKYFLVRQNNQTSIVGYCRTIKIQSFNPQLYQRCSCCRYRLWYHKSAIIWQSSKVDWWCKTPTRWRLYHGHSWKQKWSLIITSYWEIISIKTCKK